jgi:hypothetical protein
MKFPACLLFTTLLAAQSLQAKSPADSFIAEYARAHDFNGSILVQNGDQTTLDLQATIDRYLPEYAGEAAHRSTIHQLLNHTSGIDNFGQVKSAQEAIEKARPISTSSSQKSVNAWSTDSAQIGDQSGTHVLGRGRYLVLVVRVVDTYG